MIIDSIHSAAQKIAADCVATRVRQLGRALDRAYNEALRRHGLTGPQLTLLVASELMGAVSPSAIGRQLDIERSTLTRNLQRMQANGWIDIADAATDRGKIVQITPAGQTRLTAAFPDWQAVQARVRENFGEALLNHLQATPRR